MARQTASYLCEIATHLKIAHYASPPLCFFQNKENKQDSKKWRYEIILFAVRIFICGEYRIRTDERTA